MILGIGHEHSVGKDTFAMYIIDYLREKKKNLEVVRQGFADNLYDVCEKIYGWAGFKSRLYYSVNPAEKEVILSALGATPRDLLIGVGNKLREFDPECWMAPVVMTNPKGGLKIITDLRKPNEFKFMQDMGHYKLCIRKQGYRSERETDIDLHPFAHLWDEIIVRVEGHQGFQKQAREFTDRVILPRLQSE